MTWMYLAVLIGFVTLGFMLARRRAVAVSQGHGTHLHSLPVYHGLLAASCVFTAMLAAYALGVPLTEWLARTQALALLPTDVTSDALKRSVALRDIGNIVANQHVGAIEGTVRTAAETYARVHAIGLWLTFAAGAALGLGALGLVL